MVWEYKYFNLNEACYLLSIYLSVHETLLFWEKCLELDLVAWDLKWLDLHHLVIYDLRNVLQNKYLILYDLCGIDYLTCSFFLLNLEVIYIYIYNES